MIKLFRYVALAEAISFLGLLVNMSIGRPVPPMVTGMIHGVLFMLFAVLLMNVMPITKWSIKTAGLVFLSSLVPIVPFFVDVWLKKEEKRVASLQGE